MFKKKAKAAPAAPSDTPPAPKKRSKMKLAVLGLIPVLLAGGGYAGWLFAGPMLGLGAAEAAAPHEGEQADHGIDATHVSALPPEVVAETSFTYTFALSELLKRECGAAQVSALKAASDTEAKADGAMVNLAWIAANKRLETLTSASCDKMFSEIGRAEMKAAELAGPAEDTHKPKASAH